MAAQKNNLTEESFEEELWKWTDVVSNLYGLFDEERYYLRDRKPKAVVAAYQEAFQAVKFYEGKLEPYQDELDKILAILPKDKMQRYCELKRREIREGKNRAVREELAELRNSLDRAEWEAHPRVDQLLSLMHELETVLSLYGEHLNWVRIVALDRAIPLPEEDQTASQVAADQLRARTETDTEEMSGKVATTIAKKHSYPDKDITAVCIAVACEKAGIRDRQMVAKKLKRGAGYYYKNNNLAHFIDPDSLRTEKGKSSFSSHLHRLRKKAKDPQHEAPDGTSMSDSIRKDYKLPQK